MTRSLRSSVDVGLVAVAAAAISLFGWWSELVAFGAADWHHWLPDAVVGGAFLALAAFSASRRPVVCVLSGAVAISWWLGNVVDAAAFWHRAPLVALVLTYPDGSPASRAAGIGIGVAASLVALPAIGTTEAGTVAFGLIVLGGSLYRIRGSHGRSRRLRRVAVRAGVAIAVGTVGGAAVRTLFDRSMVTGSVTLLYELMLTTAAAVVGAGLRTPLTAPIADAVVELSRSTAPTVRDTLGRLLDDRELELGFESEGRWVAADGHEIALPAEGGGRAVTIIERDLGGRAVIVHDESLLEDGALMAAVSNVARLWSANVELDAAMRSQLDELTASRRRLATTEQEELRRLASQLADGPMRRLTTIDGELKSAAGVALAASTVDAIARARDQLARTIEDLEMIAGGLQPYPVEGDLVDAVRALAERAPLPVDVHPSGSGAVSPSAATVVYFCCSEAIANAVKHAGASRISIELAVSAHAVRVDIDDDGVGGADPKAGTGLRGLVDRVAVAGGKLRIDSPTGAGTRVSVELPLDGHLTDVDLERR